MKSRINRTREKILLQSPLVIEAKDNNHQALLMEYKEKIQDYILKNSLEYQTLSFKSVILLTKKENQIEVFIFPELARNSRILSTPLDETNMTVYLEGEKWDLATLMDNNLFYYEHENIPYLTEGFFKKIFKYLPSTTQEDKLVKYIRIATERETMGLIWKTLPEKDNRKKGDRFVEFRLSVDPKNEYPLIVVYAKINNPIEPTTEWKAYGIGDKNPNCLPHDTLQEVVRGLENAYYLCEEEKGKYRFEESKNVKLLLDDKEISFQEITFPRKTLPLTQEEILKDLQRHRDYIEEEYIKKKAWKINLKLRF